MLSKKLILFAAVAVLSGIVLAGCSSNVALPNPKEPVNGVANPTKSSASYSPDATAGPTENTKSPYSVHNPPAKLASELTLVHIGSALDFVVPEGLSYDAGTIQTATSEIKNQKNELKGDLNKLKADGAISIRVEYLPTSNTAIPDYKHSDRYVADLRPFRLIGVNQSGTEVGKGKQFPTVAKSKLMSNYLVRLSSDECSIEQCTITTPSVDSYLRAGLAQSLNSTFWDQSISYTYLAMLNELMTYRDNYELIDETGKKIGVDFGPSGFQPATSIQADIFDTKFGLNPLPTYYMEGVCFGFKVWFFPGAWKAQFEFLGPDYSTAAKLLIFFHDLPYIKG